MLPEKRRSGPADHGPASKLSIATDESIVPPTTDVIGDLDDVVRCRCCHRPLTAESSVRWEMGPTCRRLVADLPGVA